MTKRREYRQGFDAKSNEIDEFGRRKPADKLSARAYDRPISRCGERGCFVIWRHSVAGDNGGLKIGGNVEFAVF